VGGALLSAGGKPGGSASIGSLNQENLEGALGPGEKKAKRWAGVNLRGTGKSRTMGKE